MLGEYKLSRPTRRCAIADRPLRDGEWYYSVLLEDGDDYARQDIAAENWKGPPEGTIGHWKRRIPAESEKKLVLAPPEVLIDLLRQMDRFPQRAKSRYLLALMLMRRRLLAPGETSTDAQGNRWTTFTVVRDGSEIPVQTCEISRSESETLREELNQWLYTEADDESDDGADA